MTVTEYGYCPNCDVDHVELVMTGAGVLACHKCGNVGIYDDRESYEAMQEHVESYEDVE